MTYKINLGGVGELLLSIGTLRRICNNEKKTRSARGFRTQLIWKGHDGENDHVPAKERQRGGKKNHQIHTWRESTLQHLTSIHGVCKKGNTERKVAMWG